MTRNHEVCIQKGSLLVGTRCVRARALASLDFFTPFGSEPKKWIFRFTLSAFEPTLGKVGPWRGPHGAQERQTKRSPEQRSRVADQPNKTSSLPQILHAHVPARSRSPTSSLPTKSRRISLSIDSQVLPVSRLSSLLLAPVSIFFYSTTNVAAGRLLRRTYPKLPSSAPPREAA